MSKKNGKQLNKQSKFTLRGGDGYSANPFQPIGGMMSYPRYSNNYRPVFNGELLHNGGAKKGEDCGCKKKEASIFNLIKQNGGADITQVSAISEVGKMITPLSIGGLISVIMVVFLYHYTNKKPRKGVQMGGYTNQLESILAPLGKNNLLVLASLLLLHHFAVMNSKSRVAKRGNKLKKIQSGGNIINSILNTLFNFDKKNSNSKNNNIIETINNSFKNDEKDLDNDNTQTGGDGLLKSYVKHLGGEAFYANSIFYLLENIFNNKIKIINSNNSSDKLKLKNSIIKKNNKLFYVLSPISFNIFGSEDTVQKIFSELKKQK